MKKTILTISLILFCFEFLKAQELTIDDLQKSVIAGSIDRTDSLLRAKGYRLTGLPEEGDKDTSYKFEKSTEIGNLDIISVYKNIDEAGTRIAYVIFDNETKFYRLKKDCEKLREIQKIDEFSNPGVSFTRRYCDRFFIYTFKMMNDKDTNKLTYAVFVAFHSYPCQKSK